MIVAHKLTCTQQYCTNLFFDTGRKNDQKVTVSFATDHSNDPRARRNDVSAGVTVPVIIDIAVIVVIGEER
jgi:hypothetical protein